MRVSFFTPRYKMYIKPTFSSMSAGLYHYDNARIESTRNK